MVVCSSLRRLYPYLLHHTHTHTHSQFPWMLDMDPYTIEGLSRQEKDAAPAEQKMYELVGIVVHSGQASAGHYYSFIKKKRCVCIAFSFTVSFTTPSLSLPPYLPFSSSLPFFLPLSSYLPFCIPPFLCPSMAPFPPSSLISFVSLPPAFALLSILPPFLCPSLLPLTSSFSPSLFSPPPPLPPPPELHPAL